MKYSVYLLLKDENPVYIGMSSNMKNRLCYHKKTKDFNYYVIIEKFKNKKEALAAERAIIKYISIFTPETIQNTLYWAFNKDIMHKRYI